MFSDYTHVEAHRLVVLIRVAFGAGALVVCSVWVPNTLAKHRALWPIGVKPSSVPGNLITTVSTDALPFSQVSTAIGPGVD